MERAWWHASRLWTRWISRDLESCGRDAIIVLPCSVHGPDCIAIGNRVHIGPYCRVGALNGARITIGDGCEIVGGCSLFAHTDGIEIGRQVLTAWNVQIYDAQHGTADPETPIRLQGLTRAGKVRIGDAAWLEANVVVLQGVTIGRGRGDRRQFRGHQGCPGRRSRARAPARVTDGSAALHEQDRR